MVAHSVKNVLGESISSISMWNFVNQLGKRDFLVVRFFMLACSKCLERTEIFFRSKKRNCFYLVLARCDRNCCTMDKLGCANSTVNKIF